MSEAFDRARALTITLLNRELLRTEDVIRGQVQKAASITYGFSDADAEALVAQLMHEANVLGPVGTLMDDPSDHKEWLTARRGTVDWKFWNRYRDLLLEVKKLPEPVVTALGRLTDDILGRLEDPDRLPQWDCRGMVVGSVQSGKTANYCGLICKAIDAGYRLIIVLAGMHNSLRSQTQYRVDEGIVGRDSSKERNLNQANSLIGVGKLFTERLQVTTLTSSSDDGDFKAPKADTSVDIGGHPVILVIKKNGSVLRNLIKWVLRVRGDEMPGQRRKVVRGVPMLVIDDEADNASINTKEKRRRRNESDEESVTAINGRIRELLDAFEKSAYVGYTATPFANIFINPDAETPKHGEDLFPRSFILNVSPPSNYISPAKVFGLDGDVDAGIDPKDGLPLCELVDDHEDTFPPKHGTDLVVCELPGSLKRAFLFFVLVCAARRARGQRESHNSMLVHVARFTAVQNQVKELMQELVETVRLRIQMGEGERTATLLGHLERLWRDEFVPKSEIIRSMAPEEDLPVVTWEQVAAELPEATSRIEVKEINGKARDALDYLAHRQGHNVVAVGGDKLSRGLTLEGLSITYFLRASRMYDTLMQMGRWFGYRPGYLDLCRLFTTEDLQSWFRHIALAEVELRREFDRMTQAGLTPRRYGLRVREHPGGLLVTALNKMTHARTQKLSYAGQLVQTAHFSTVPSIVRGNADVVDRFLCSLGGPAAAVVRSAAWLWTNVAAESLLRDLMLDFQVASESWRLQKAELVEFISRQVEGDELTRWTVALVSTEGNAGSHCLGGCKAGVAERSPEDGAAWESGRVPAVYATRNANIQSPSHQALDLEEMPLNEDILKGLLDKRADREGGPLFMPHEEALLRKGASDGATLAEVAQLLTNLRRKSDEPQSRKVRINGEIARQLRPKTQGLLLIYPLLPKGKTCPADGPPFMGLAFSFPSSHTARSIDYKVNKIWQSTFPEDEREN